MVNSTIRLKINSAVVICGRVCVANEEVSVDAKIADRLIERGVATMIGKESDEAKNTNDDFDSMTVDELKEYAAEAGIDLAGVTKKADILTKLRGEM